MTIRSDLQDLRYLHLAKGIEEMFEGLERAFTRHIPLGAVRDTLAPIFEDGPAHRRLKEAFSTLNASLAAKEASINPVHLLEAILACEKAAEKFYLANVGQLSDPALQDVFRGLAKEEGQHIRFVEQALSIERAVQGSQP